MLVGAYRSTVLNTVPENMGYLSTLPVNSAISVVNNHDYCRGGDNRSDYDVYSDADPFRSDLCKPRTNLSRGTMRTYARNAGHELLCYDYYKTIFYWNYVIEYANFNCQDAFNTELTSDGYRQGGLGVGVTYLNSTVWSNYNKSYPITTLSYCNEYGNNTGIKDLIIPDCTSIDEESTIETHTFKVPRWRGFDNPFGDIWTKLEGVIIQEDEEGNHKTVYTTTNPDNFGDSDVYKEKMRIAGHEIHSDGYTKTFDLGETAEIIPSSVGGSATTYKCDFYWAGGKNTSLRRLLVGGIANSGSSAGLAGFNSRAGVAIANSDVGFRQVIVL